MHFQFFHLLQQATILAEWKTARISPLYKKGPIPHACKYRMLAVVGTSYRLNATSTLVMSYTLYCKSGAYTTRYLITVCSFPRMQHLTATLYIGTSETCCLKIQAPWLFTPVRSVD
eukprot:1156201-Pelagomonas_calceolata.AAC.2